MPATAWRSVPAVALAQPSLDQILGRVAVPAMNLHGKRIGFEAPLGRKRLRDGSKQIEHQSCAITDIARRSMNSEVPIPARRDEEGETALDDGLLSEEHASHIRVLDDGNLRTSRITL